MNEALETNYDEDTVAAVKTAASQGLYTMLPADNQLQIDWDTPAGFPPKYTELHQILHERWTIVHENFTTSKNGNRHLIFTLKNNLAPLERIALQAIFGSDPMREMLSLVGFKFENRAFPTLLFEKT